MGGEDAGEPTKKKRTKNQDPFVTSSDGIRIMAAKTARNLVSIRLETHDLEKFFEAMHAAEDADHCVSGTTKRQYVKSGKFKKSDADNAADDGSAE